MEFMAFPPELRSTQLVIDMSEWSRKTPDVVFFIIVPSNVLPLDDGVNVTPSHWLDIRSNEICPTTFPCLSPVRTTGCDGVP